MAFRLKGSTRIVVDGVAYRWRIRQKPTYDQAAYGTTMTVSIQIEVDPACVLLVKTGSPRPDNWLGLEASPVYPSDVRQYIVDALSDGWNPTQNGNAFLLDRRTGW